MKDKYPIAFRKAIESQIDRFKHPNISLDNSTDKGDVFTYNVHNLNFFFAIRNFKSVQGKIQCTIDFRPINRENFSNTAVTSDVEGTTKLFKNWLDIVEEVSNYQSIFDYSRIYEEYDKELFDLNDFNEDKTTDDLLQLDAQIRTTEFLAYISDEIRQIPEYQNNKEINNVLQDIDHLSSHVGEFRKKQVFKLTIRYLSVIRTHYFPVFLKIVKKIDINKALELVSKGIDIYLKLKSSGQ